MKVIMLSILLLLTSIGNTAEPIDRHALVSRHDVHFQQIDPAAPAMVGNGNFAFTADITGLQTFPKQYSPLVPLLTQAQWAWHSFPNPQHFKYQDSLVPVDVRGSTQYYPWARERSPVVDWLRQNPHRFSLGRVSLYLMSKQGKPAEFADLSATQQTLDLWNGTLSSQFRFDGETIQVETRVHPDLDMVMVTLTGAALADRRLGVDIRFPGVAANLNPDPADWEHPERHRTTVTARAARGISLERQLDDTRYFVKVSTDADVSFERTTPHALRILSRGKQDSITFLVLFSEHPHAGRLPESRAAVSDYWNRYWATGGVVDLSGSTDSRAPELERRIVLSQYLMAVNAAGSLPPQEEGLFSNSWYGKFHLEMPIWHQGQFAPWGHADLLERSMGWYLKQLPQAKERARSHGVQGAWWPKMVGPDGRESPSAINPFIMWQQPSPMYLAELIYRAKPTRATLERYHELVFATADLLASFPHFDAARQQYVLGPPIIPAQEVFPPLTTYNPAFELEYFRFGLMTAQTWRQRLGLPRNPQWDAVLAKLAPLPQAAGIYLATESFPRLWDSPQLRRDHPSFLGALGLLPGPDVDRQTMRRTLRAVESSWDLRQTWGWDFPLMAMTATRLHEPQKAIDFLFADEPNNHFGATGMTPRLHLDGDVFQRDAETYFPSNGSLLLAVALMAAGWDGEATPAPGFPKGWQVRSEGLQPLP